MGIVNVTPDSFSDGGRWFDPERAVAHGLALLDEGADILDVGGESTRPGAARPAVEEEMRRVLPVVRELVAAGATVSVDTMRAEVAAHAVEAGAALVNDVSGGLADPAMLPLMARAGTPYVLMHWRGHSAGMQANAVYGDVVADVVDELRARVDAALRAGVPGTVSSSTRGSGSPSTPSTTGGCSAGSGRSPRSACRSWWARRGSPFWGTCSRTRRRGGPARRTFGTRPPPRCRSWPPRGAPGACASTTSPRRPTRYA